MAKIKLPEKTDTNPNHYSSTSRNKAMKREIFINEFLRTGDAGASAKAAGYKGQNMGNKLLNEPEVIDEITRRQKASEEDGIASGNDAMRFLTEVMNGQIKDQFNLDATLSDRLVACKEILKRTKDIELKQSSNDNKIDVNINWDMGSADNEE